MVLQPTNCLRVLSPEIGMLISSPLKHFYSYFIISANSIPSWEAPRPQSTWTKSSNQNLEALLSQLLTRLSPWFACFFHHLVWMFVAHFTCSFPWTISSKPFHGSKVMILDVGNFNKGFPQTKGKTLRMSLSSESVSQWRLGKPKTLDMWWSNIVT